MDIPLPWPEKSSILSAPLPFNSLHICDQVDNHNFLLTTLQFFLGWILWFPVWRLQGLVIPGICLISDIL